MCENNNRYIIHNPNTTIDQALKRFKKFCGEVVSFGVADGFASISITQGADCAAEHDMGRGWKYHPPYQYLLVLLDGTVQTMVDYFAEGERKATLSYRVVQKMSPEELRNNPAIDDGTDDKIYWVVNCKSGLVCADSKLNVRNGFWTRIVSESLDLAVDKTIELWEEESNKPDSEKWSKVDGVTTHIEPRIIDDTERTLCLMEEENSIKPLDLLFEDFLGKEKIPDLTNRQWHRIYEFLIDNALEAMKIYRIMKKTVPEEIFKKFLGFRKQEDKIKQERIDARCGEKFVEWEEVKNNLHNRRKRRVKFYNSIK